MSLHYISSDISLALVLTRTTKKKQAKTKKNIETDLIGDKVGRIHVGKQDLDQMQTRKMKGLKRSRDEDVDMADEAMEDQEVKKSKA